jgi:hypothetical protein
MDETILIRIKNEKQDTANKHHDNGFITFNIVGKESYRKD